MLYTLNKELLFVNILWITFWINEFQVLIVNWKVWVTLFSDLWERILFFLPRNHFGKNARFLLHDPLRVDCTSWRSSWILQKGKYSFFGWRCGQWISTHSCWLSESESIAEEEKLLCCFHYWDRYDSLLFFGVCLIFFVIGIEVGFMVKSDVGLTF